jgi:redox-sensitive bicupin YhaK (pirin superfamily)
LIERIIEPRVVPLVGSATVKRLLPRGGRGVGPFLFLDHFGPWEAETGSSKLDVPPHPHIGLSTLTYLFEGEMVHRDSLGTVQPIRPGEVNWMTAGKGVVHSERVPPGPGPDRRVIHGLQAWVALPERLENVEPTFEHHDRAAVPRWESEGVSYELLAGAAMGMSSPVRCHSRLFYLLARAAGACELRFDPEGQDAGLYLVSGELAVSDRRVRGPALIVFKPGARIELAANGPFDGVFLGGENLGPRQMVWNFVSSSTEAIERAKLDWREQRFPKIAGETEWVRLP